MSAAGSMRADCTGGVGDVGTIMRSGTPPVCFTARESQWPLRSGSASALVLSGRGHAQGSVR